MGLNRKAQFGDIFLIIAIIFGIGIFFIILAHSYDQIQPKINDALANSTTPETGRNVTELLEDTDVSLGRINLLFPLLIAGCIGFVLISALFFRSHPAFLFIGLIILAVALILAAVFSNVYEEITTTDTFSSVDQEYNIMGLFLEKLPLIIFIAFIAIVVILYFRSGGGGRI